MEIITCPQDYTVCKLAGADGFDPALPGAFYAHTGDEISLVCPTGQTPARTTHRADGWRMFRVAGTLEFGMVGVLAGITAALAEAQVSIFVVSTYDTDYFWVKTEKAATAVAALRQKGYTVTGG